MKPIIIEIRDGKVVMDIKEFKKHIEDAYHQGYSDGSAIGASYQPCLLGEVTCCNDLQNTQPTITGDTLEIRYRSSGEIDGVLR